ncbi:MAG: hypothetical protein IPL87_01315 [Candidatus Moraniibacteriota bacterium]|nr:MAG: hypothetical protein IPL87_01315 [Candidatus Moranbacteria bacterium]
MKKELESVHIDDTLKKLERIAAWFDAQQEPKLEEGLKKIEEAARLLAISRERLLEIQNRFEEVKKIVDRKNL